jgi:replicative DNA helicase
MKKNGALDREFPHSVEAEMGVLGSIFCSPADAIAECVERLTPGHFFIPAHREIYDTMVDLWDSNRGIDLITFTQALRDRKLLEGVGGPAYVTVLQGFVPTAANLGYYIDILRDKFWLREIISKCTGLVRLAYEEQNGADIAAVLDRAQAELTELSRRRGDRHAVHISELVDDLMERIDYAFQHKRHPADAAGGLATGFFGLDMMTGGLKPQELIIVGARTSSGKTSFLLNVASAVALAGHPVVIFSMEMSARSITNRFGAAIAGISIQRVKDGKVQQEDLARIADRLSPLMVKPPKGIWIDDSTALHTTDLKARARRMVAQHKVELIIVDYLQKMVSPSPRAKNNRAIEVTEIAQCLKNIAKELNVPVLAAAQLNRQPGERKKEFEHPKLTDLRESGDIENEADLCLLLWRPWTVCNDRGDREALAKKLNVKAERVPERDAQLEAYAKLIVAKQRDGAVGDIPLRFDGSRTRFHNVKEEEEPI